MIKKIKYAYPLQKKYYMSVKVLNSNFNKSHFYCKMEYKKNVLMDVQILVMEEVKLLLVQFGE